MREGAGPDGTKGRILAAAAIEIRQIGLRRMTVSGLAARLGMSHANVYRHFEGKAGIVDALLNGWLKGFETRLQEIVDGPDPADDKLERFLATLMRGYAETYRTEGALFGLLAEPPEEAREPERHARRIEDWLERIAEEGIGTRLFTGADARKLVALVQDLAFRFISPAAIAREMTPGLASEARRDRTVRAIVRALMSRR